MIFLPYSTHLRLNQFPYVTFAVTLLCIVVFLFQITNEIEIEDLAYDYCKSDQTSDFSTRSSCEFWMILLHERENYGGLEMLKEMLIEDGFNISEANQRIDILRQHLEQFKEVAPNSVTGALMYYPNTLNPFTMLTASISHGGWMHIIFNLIFFLAFAQAVEVLIDNKRLYSSILIAIAFATGISYAFYVLISGGYPLPTLGLSGIVWGMIGLSAYLMPHAKIKVFVFVKTFLIPSWIVAIWYIGGDTWTMLSSETMGGTNFIAHVSGGFSGYLLGYFFLKERKEETREELAQEVEELIVERPTHRSLSKEGHRDMRRRMDEREANKAHSAFIIKLCQCAQTNRSGEAMAILIDSNEKHAEELFSELKPTGHSRLLLCTGRLIINQYIEQRNYAQALYFIEQCQQIIKQFVLAHPEHALFMARVAIENNKYELAYNLVHEAESRYGNYVDLTKCALMEVELLSQYLNKTDKAKERVQELLKTADSQFEQKLIKLDEIL